jgi:phosphatidylinositol-3,4,5-trisphosphate 3-phosphatase/dual-specificity protein phosphatase PTEN
VEILEVHVWGLRDGVKIAVQGYVEEGKTIKKFHTFHNHEREIVRGSIRKETGLADAAFEVMGRKKGVKKERSSTTNAAQDPEIREALDGAQEDVDEKRTDSEPPGGDVVFRPSHRVVLPSSDVNIDFERRNKTSLGGFTMVTSVTHVWFNTFFEGNGPENGGIPDESGVFEIDWDAMDGIKGSSRKGTRAFDKMAVVWKAVEVQRRSSVVINEPAEGEEVKQSEAADWRGEQKPHTKFQKQLGLRPADTDSTSISRASSLRSQQNENANDSTEELQGVRSDVNNDEEEQRSNEKAENDASTSGSQTDGVSESNPGMNHVPTAALPGGQFESDLEDSKKHTVGQWVNVKKSGNST